MSLINVQKLSNGALISGGKLYIGTYLSNEPEVNPVTVYTDAALTQGIDISTGADLDQDGFPLVNGVRTSLYIGVNFSLQIRDRNGAPVWPLKAQQETVTESTNGFDPEVIYDLENGVNISGSKYGQVMTSATLPSIKADKFSTASNGGSLSVDLAEGITISSDASSIVISRYINALDLTAMNIGDSLTVYSGINGSGGESFLTDYQSVTKSATGYTVSIGWSIGNGTDAVGVNQSLYGDGSSDYEIEHETITTPNIPTYADEAEALAGGLASNAWYKTAAGELRIKL